MISNPLNDKEDIDYVIFRLTSIGTPMEQQTIAHSPIQPLVPANENDKSHKKDNEKKAVGNIS